MNLLNGICLTMSIYCLWERSFFFSHCVGTIKYIDNYNRVKRLEIGTDWNDKTGPNRPCGVMYYEVSLFNLVHTGISYGPSNVYLDFPPVTCCFVLGMINDSTMAYEWNLPSWRSHVADELRSPHNIINFSFQEDYDLFVVDFGRCFSITFPSYSSYRWFYVVDKLAQWGGSLRLNGFCQYLQSLCLVVRSWCLRVRFMYANSAGSSFDCL